MKNHLKIRILFLSVLALAIILLPFLTGSVNAQDVPPEWQLLYNVLDGKLEQLNSYIDANWDGTKYPVIYGMELLAASPNRGDMVLEAQTFQGIKYNLDKYKQMGATGVSMDIKYPVLSDWFPKAQDYIELYKRVVQEVRDRDFTFLIAIQSVFTDSVFGRQDIDFSGLTLEQYKQDKHAMAQLVINELHPDYLTIECEPKTQQMNTGLDFSVVNYVDIINFTLNGLQKHGTLVGAGAGTWDDMVYFRQIAQIDGIDYFDIHIYPINEDLVFDRMNAIQRLALDNDKKLVIGECWLHKCIADDLVDPQLSYIDLFARDVYEFWTPLDVEFIKMIINLSHFMQIEFVSPFWMQFYWAYLPYNNDTKYLDPKSRYSLLNDLTGQSMLANQLTQTGQTFKSLITETTSIDKSESHQLNADIDLTVHPNPASNFVNVTSNTDGLVIYDLSGRQIWHQKNADSYTIDLNNWTEGVYFASNSTVVKKVLVIKSRH